MSPGVGRGNTYLYRVRAVGGAGALSPPSAVVMATAITFEDAAIAADVTPIKARRVDDLRTAVDAVRRAAGCTAGDWQPSVLGRKMVRAAQVQDLCDRLDEALRALGLPAAPYEDPILRTGAGGTPVREVRFDELRARALDPRERRHRLGALRLRLRGGAPRRV